MKEILFKYKPFEFSENGDFDEKNFETYLRAESDIKIMDALVIEPFNEKLKASDRDEWIFDDLRLKKLRKKQEYTKWKDVYNKLELFLEIRANDSRAKQLVGEGLKYFDGVGYCIAVTDVLNEFDKIKKQFTSISEWDQIEWPKPRKDEAPLRSLLIPNRSYRQITEENARIVLACHRFKSCLKKEVLDRYELANKIWLDRQTGWSDKNIPPADVSPVERTRLIGEKYIFVQLIREESPQYKDILTAFIDGLKKNNEEYRFREENGILYVNIKNLRERLHALYDKSTKIGSRYVIVP